MPRSVSVKDIGFEMQPALKLCVTTGLTKKEIERAGVTVRHAITKVIKSRKSLG